jgi:gamma-glutamyltranspeptidase / glutathione hydrolase
VILNTLDFGMSITDAVAVARFSATSDVIDVSNRVPRAVARELTQDGYEVARSYLSYAFAAVHAIKIDGGLWTGGADPGHDGMALAVRRSVAPAPGSPSPPAARAGTNRT